MTKYMKGQREHGGCLWLKEDLLDNAIDEAVDQVIYLLTLRQQQQEGYIPLDDGDGDGLSGIR